MLQSMRKSAGSCVAKALFILLLLSFLGWGIADWTGTNATLASDALTVNGESVSEVELQNAFYRDVQMARSYSPNMGEEQLRGLLLGSSLQRVIDMKLLRQYAENAGLDIDQSGAVDLALQDRIFFEDGIFSRFRLDETMANMGLTQAAFAEAYGEDRLRRLLSDSLAPESFKAPAALADRLVAHDAQRRVASVLRVASDRLVQMPEPTDADIQGQYDANQPKYTRPEFRTVDLILVTAADLAPRQEVSDAELQAAYDSAGTRFNQPEKRDIDAARFETAEQAQKFKDAMAAEGADFKAVAEAMQGTVLNFPGTTQEQLIVSDLRAPSFAAAQNELVGPVATSLGAYIARVGTIVPASTQTLDSVRETLRAELQQRKAADRVRELEPDLEDEIAAGHAVAEIAQALDLPLQTAIVMDSFGRNEASQPALQSPALAQVASGAFETAVDAEPELVQLEGGGMALVDVTAIKAPELQALDSVRDLVVTDWRAAKLRDLADAERATLLASLQSGEVTLEALATRFEVGVEQTPPFTRDGAGWTNAPMGLVDRAFKLAEGKVDAMTSAGDQYFLRLDSIDRAALPDDPMAADSRRTDVDSAMRRDIQEQLLAALRREAEVQRNDAAIDRVIQLVR